MLVLNAMITTYFTYSLSGPILLDYLFCTETQASELAQVLQNINFNSQHSHYFSSFSHNRLAISYALQNEISELVCTVWWSCGNAVSVRDVGRTGSTWAFLSTATITFNDTINDAFPPLWAASLTSHSMLRAQGIHLRTPGNMRPSDNWKFCVRRLLSSGMWCHVMW
jgi:hypothetical protein